MLEHLGPPMEQAWAHLGKARLDDATKALLNQQVSKSYGSDSFDVLAKIRDDKEVAVMKGLASVETAR